MSSPITDTIQYNHRPTMPLNEMPLPLSLSLWIIINIKLTSNEGRTK
jgi:hypothetical protein